MDEWYKNKNKLGIVRKHIDPKKDGEPQHATQLKYRVDKPDPSGKWVVLRRGSAVPWIHIPKVFVP